MVNLDNLFNELKKEHYLKGISRQRYIGRMAYYLGELNAIHPFREGNGRTQRLFIEYLSTYAGRPIVLDYVPSEAMYSASEAAFFTDYGLLEDIISKVL